jgi:hypothetical protein
LVTDWSLGPGYRRSEELRGDRRGGLLLHRGNMAVDVERHRHLGMAEPVPLSMTACPTIGLLSGSVALTALVVAQPSRAGVADNAALLVLEGRG